MANTENIEAKLCAYIDGDLDAAGRAEIEKHLAANPQHRGLIEQLARQRDLLRELPRESAPEEIIDALQTQMERSVLLGDADAAAEAETLRIQRWPQIMALAAIVLLTVGLGLIIYMVLPRTGGDANYALSTTRSGAALEESVDVGTASDAVALRDRDGGLGASRAASEDALSAPAAPETPNAAASVTESLPAQPPLADATAAPTEPEKLLSKDAATGAAEHDVFADRPPAAYGLDATPASPDGSALAMNDLLDVRARLQNADLARQLKAAPGGLDDQAVFVIVNTADGSATRNQVKEYLEANRITWDAVSRPMPQPIQRMEGQAVNLSRAARSDVRLKSGPLQPGQSGQGGVPPVLMETESKPYFDGPTTDKNQLPARQQELASTQAPQGEPQQQAPAAVRQEMAGVADSGQAAGEPAGVVSNAVKEDAALLQATSQPQQQLGQPGVQQHEAAEGGRLIIARGMTRQQAAELSRSLSTQTSVQRAALYEQRLLAAATPGPTPEPIMERRRQLQWPPTDPARSTTAPATAPADRYGQLSLADAAPTTAPAAEGLIVPPVIPATQPTTTTAPAPIPLTAAPPEALTDLAPATQPAATDPLATAAAADERVDVVIVVQDDVPLGEITETAPAPTPALPPAPEPTTAPAATTVPSAPSTQPHAEPQS